MYHPGRSFTWISLLGSFSFNISVYASPPNFTSADWGPLRHQEEALWYLMQRECGPVPPEFSLWRPVESDGHVR